MEFFVGQIQLFPFTFAPRDWLPCDGRILSIAQNTVLFSLIGTQFGGDGQTTFALPRLTGPAPNVGYYILINGAYPSRAD